MFSDLCLISINGVFDQCSTGWIESGKSDLGAKRQEILHLKTTLCFDRLSVGSKGVPDGHPPSRN